MKEEEAGGKVGKDRRDVAEEGLHRATRREQKTRHRKKGGCVERRQAGVKVENVG